MPANNSITVLKTPPIAARRDFHTAMYAFYSSEYDAIITDPAHMQVPVDDHLVHRGDGVFETLKCVDGRVYCLEEHLDRLYYSAKEIALVPPVSREAVRHSILETIRAGGHRDCLARVLLSRGVGSMGISPLDCPRAGLYILAHKTVAPFMETHPGGAHLITSNMPVKAGFFATIKTCNYLPNALMKKEAIDRGADFAVNFDEAGFLAEGATENIGIVDANSWLVIPQPGRILPGTTMQRAYELASQGVAAKWITGKKTSAIRREDLLDSREILIFGTTTNVTAVTRLDGRLVGDGRPGAVSIKLGKLLLAEQTSDNPFAVRAFA